MAPKNESYLASGISLALPAIAGEYVTSWQHNFFAERVRDEDFYRRLPVATLHEQNKKYLRNLSRTATRIHR